MGARIVGSYTIHIAGFCKASELVLGYPSREPWITDESFPLEEHPSLVRKIEFLKFDQGADAEEVLAELVALGLERPTYEDALNFGIQYPSVQSERPLAFLHEPVLTPDGVLVHIGLHIIGGPSSRDLSLYPINEGPFSRTSWFAGVRP